MADPEIVIWVVVRKGGRNRLLPALCARSPIRRWRPRRPVYPRTPRRCGGLLRCAHPRAKLRAASSSDILVADAAGCRRCHRIDPRERAGASSAAANSQGARLASATNIRNTQHRSTVSSWSTPGLSRPSFFRGGTDARRTLRARQLVRSRALPEPSYAARSSDRRALQACCDGRAVPALHGLPPRRSSTWCSNSSTYRTGFVLLIIVRRSVHHFTRPC